MGGSNTRETVEMDTECPNCGSTKVVGRYGGDSPAKVECQDCGHFGTSLMEGL